MFSGLIRMRPECKHCGLHYEREPGYFLGSIYVNYGLTAITTTILYVALRFGVEYDNRLIVWPLAAFCVAFPVFFFRYARAYWLAMDLSFDRPLADAPPEPHDD
jgi:uncharacterized protein (DUF983 family)